MQSEQEQKIKRQIGYRWDNSLIKKNKNKTNIEGELISEIGNDSRFLQILGPLLGPRWWSSW